MASTNTFVTQKVDLTGTSTEILEHLIYVGNILWLLLTFLIQFVTSVRITRSFGQYSCLIFSWGRKGFSKCGPEQYHNINFLRYTVRTSTIAIKRHDTDIRAWLESAEIGSRDIWISLFIIWY